MRLFNKFHAVCALAVCSILLSAWLLASQHYYRRVASTDPANGFRAAKTFDRRLVVFGDSWSDDNNGGDEVQGSVWTEWLCSMFSCHHENLAETAKSLRGTQIGSVVDNSELSGILLSLSKSPVADFKTQMNRWTAAESQVLEELAGDEAAIASRLNHTIVAVSFGVWDVWNMIGKDYDSAVKTVDHSVETIMDQLDSLSRALGTDDLKVILTLAPDVTFLPAFKGAAEQRVTRHKDTVRVAEYWNKKLRESAEKWDHGLIYLFDTNAFLVDLIRDRQLYDAGIEEPNGLGKNADPGWENVDDSCVENGKQVVMTSEVKRCETPEKYLFWNDMHLGPSAHRLMGTEVFHGIEKMWLK
ncbi:hypothetical protein P170DRAFT_344416 [Aspergillus steynii IBT 23096]|uniref:SGNH hydrolase n=1 Tax=Aspergillus steynii IBT 23096 TaxID=1392250 RepID=A0A2I2GQ52_9EURO|nr:uncharacterized protein P170DRAFT_344416 [Aspergillus steynii IBT 23096]PLB55003.1 hypothetical protein P170DRAFT_344416 [Aspergillus steynii IBT 23096]